MWIPSHRFPRPGVAIESVPMKLRLMIVVTTLVTPMPRRPFPAIVFPSMRVFDALSSSWMPLQPFCNLAPVIDRPITLFSIVFRLPPRITMPSPALPLMTFGEMPPITFSDAPASEIPAGPEPGAAVPSAVVPIKFPSMKFRTAPPVRTRPDPLLPDNTLSRTTTFSAPFARTTPFWLGPLVTPSLRRPA